MSGESAAAEATTDLDTLDILTLRAMDRGCVAESEPDDSDTPAQACLTGFPDNYDCASI